MMVLVNIVVMAFLAFFTGVIISVALEVITNLLDKYRNDKEENETQREDELDF